MSHSRWKLPTPATPDHPAGALGFSRLMVQLLYNRGLTELSQIQSFLAADESLSANPFLLPDMSLAVTRIYRALLSGEAIAVYGDFDVDGVSSTALLVHGLSALGGKAVPYIPHRLTEGYGLNSAALESLYQRGISLVISADCGVTAVNEVKRAQRLGLDVIITDHHTVPQEMPPALAVVNPKRPDSAYPFLDLAGVGVAFKLLQAVFQSMGRDGYPDTLLDLVALGTIADSVPLLGENRYLAGQGLKLINTSPRLGVQEMINQTQLKSGNIDAEDISWVIAPRLNAAGRLEHAMTSYRLLATDSPEEAQALAAELGKKNEERQELTTRFMAKAKEQVLAEGVSPMLIVSDEDYPIGIAGLVASRLAEEFYRPSIVIRTGEKMSRGSARSIPEFNIIQALTRCRHLFTQFGGHSQAAGFNMLTGNLPELGKCLLQMAAEKLGDVDLRPSLDIDAVVSLPALSGSTYQMIQKLAPFGEANTEPIFLSRKVELVDCRVMGNNGGHLRLKLRQGGTVWNGVGFRMGERLCEMSSPIDIVYSLGIDKWNGQEMLRLNILDFAPGDTQVHTD